jgi:hypothetical protein
MLKRRLCGKRSSRRHINGHTLKKISNFPLWQAAHECFAIAVKSSLSVVCSPIAKFGFISQF